MTSQTAKAILARRERVNTLTAQGVPTDNIAQILGVSTRTVERQRTATGGVAFGPAPVNEDRYRRVTCTVCGRTVRNRGGGSLLYCIHNGTNGELCSNSELPIPVAEGTRLTHSRRIKQVTALAGVVQDEDPSVVDTYLTALSGHELQAIALYALAALDLDRHKDELFPKWTRELKVGA